tara:strand:+ start:140 stop:838 length:699 start_codon:yes stop_codon:yes gene_type:complete
MSENSDATVADDSKPAPKKRKTAGSSKSSAANKAKNAFRTISEVSEELDVPQHVLRFWETKFTVVKPMKRAGGRRYYRPQDVELLKQIQRLLHDDGYTIKGVQKVLKSARGVSSAIEKVMEIGAEATAESVSEDLTAAEEGAEAAADTTAKVEDKPEVAPQGDTVVAISAKQEAQVDSKQPAADVVPDSAPDVPAGPSKREQAMETALRETLAEFKSLRAEIDGLIDQVSAG